jgi:hypothetical protein
VFKLKSIEDGFTKSFLVAFYVAILRGFSIPNEDQFDLKLWLFAPVALSLNLHSDYYWQKS